MGELTPVVLIIMDGWGCRDAREGNAIALANTPVLSGLQKNYAFARIGAAGEAVGLPAGQMGNSEVGHLNIGAGRIVYQELTRINKSIEEKDFFNNEVLIRAMKRLIGGNGSLHLMGLLSDGGVHSHINQLYALLKMAKEAGIGQKVFIHALLDGRDVAPDSGAGFVAELHNHCRQTGSGRIATISGRYYTMDRDNRWERVKKAYDLYVYGDGPVEHDPVNAVQAAYRRGETDEFVSPVAISARGEEPAKITSDDSLIFFNFRPDRVRQITSAFLNKDFNAMERGERPPFPYLVTFTEYDKNFGLPVAFPTDSLNNTLGQWLAEQGLSQLRLAETEKYAHVTFFFNGGREKPFHREERALIPSPKVATYDLQPEMSAFAVAEKACKEIAVRHHQFIVINFANADMVGHTGVMDAAITAVEAVDKCVGMIVEAALQNSYSVLITADHGNADMMIDPDTGGPFTAHTTSDVPLFLVEEPARYNLADKGILADIAPTVLQLMGLTPPPEMEGKSMLI